MTESTRRVRSKPLAPTAPTEALETADATTALAPVASVGEPPAPTVPAPAPPRSAAVVDDEPDPRILWRWVAKAGRPWAGWGFILLGLIFTIVGWIGVSGEAIVAKQIPYVVSGGIIGVMLAVIGAYFLGTEELRKDSGRLDRLERMVDELHTVLLARADAPQVRVADVAAGPAGNGSSPEHEVVLVVAGGETFHAHGCPMAVGKETEELAVDAARSRGLSACPLCSPTPEATVPQS